MVSSTYELCPSFVYFPNKLLRDLKRILVALINQGQDETQQETTIIPRLINAYILHIQSKKELQSFQ